MFKLGLFVLGVTAGAAGVASWLLSEPSPPDPAIPPSQPSSADSLEARLAMLKTRVRTALAEGERDRQSTEEHLRRKLDAYRRGSGEPTPS